MLLLPQFLSVTEPEINVKLDCFCFDLLTMYLSTLTPASDGLGLVSCGAGGVGVGWRQREGATISLSVTRLYTLLCGAVLLLSWSQSQ